VELWLRDGAQSCCMIQIACLLVSYRPTSLVRHSTLPPATAADVLAQTISAYLLPFNLLPCDWQLPPQSLKRTLAQLSKRPVEIFLVLFLRCRNLSHDILLADAIQRHVLLSEQSYVAVLVVMYINFDRSGERVRGWVVDV
jgi:hypothetical protein